MRELHIQQANTRKEIPKTNELVFGRHYSDHMFVMDYEDGKGWFNPRIVPYNPITLDPAAMIFHYGQTVFEGLKAYRTSDDQILMFRPEENFKRLNRSSERLSMPKVHVDEMIVYLKQLLKLDKEWIPKEEGYSLYIRPFIISTESNLSLAPSKTYTCMIILSPVGSYYKEGIKPVRIHVEEDYTRAVKGGTGTAKTAGNYSAAYKAQEKATEEGYSQVLWLDGIEKKYIEEVGSMNVFFKINGEVVTPKLNGSILEGITRKSIIELLQKWGIIVNERQISIDELFTAYERGELEEAFGTGTAAVISPVGELKWNDRQMVINNRQTGDLAQKLYITLTSIQTGKEEDPFGWVVHVQE
ncbi:branched-chain amino acid aminotransferase [Halalkalibacter hemicellulosilyticus]|uniref:Branched-chain-amino-acid aminotransferase n=1 Tax=Halalkalibacter hemicellulosilyticusJCM 9152 TaxID=1236971 RepID=W4QEY0_9BACI|nr:branched-chain amino acid aminotransferase [Halalkalibacter hemicellulosilyticus]GAE30626.1 branched-chain amino acid aminotransferase [Halalkalibacter hemicellulosilyticusJCM 9152]